MNKMSWTPWHYVVAQGDDMRPGDVTKVDAHLYC